MTVSSQASTQAGIGLNGTLVECEKSFGPSTHTIDPSGASDGYYEFHSQGYKIDASFLNGKSIWVSYKRDNGIFTDELIQQFLAVTSSGVWTYKPNEFGFAERDTWTTGKEGTPSYIWVSIFDRNSLKNPDNGALDIRTQACFDESKAKAAARATPTPAAPTHTVEELALAAWNKDKMLPSNDMKYNWFVIGMHQADWRDYFHNKALLQPADDQKFGDAFDAIAHRSEDRLKERAFQKSQ